MYALPARCCNQVADLFPTCTILFFSHRRRSCVCVCNWFEKHTAADCIAFACRQLDLWQDATFVVCMTVDAWLRRTCCLRVRFLSAAFILMKLYVHVCCRRKTHFWITTCRASSRYLRTNDRDLAGYLLISVSTKPYTTYFFQSCASTLDKSSRMTKRWSSEYLLICPIYFDWRKPWPSGHCEAKWPFSLPYFYCCIDPNLVIKVDSKRRDSQAFDCRKSYFGFRIQLS